MDAPEDSSTPDRTTTHSESDIGVLHLAEQEVLSDYNMNSCHTDLSEGVGSGGGGGGGNGSVIGSSGHLQSGMGLLNVDHSLSELAASIEKQFAGGDYSEYDTPTATLQNQSRNEHNDHILLMEDRSNNELIEPTEGTINSQQNKPTNSPEIPTYSPSRLAPLGVPEDDVSDQSEELPAEETNALLASHDDIHVDIGVTVKDETSASCHHDENQDSLLQICHDQNKDDSSQGRMLYEAREEDTSCVLQMDNIATDHEKDEERDETWVYPGDVEAQDILRPIQGVSNDSQAVSIQGVSIDTQVSLSTHPVTGSRSPSRPSSLNLENVNTVHLPTNHTN